MGTARYVYGGIGGLIGAGCMTALRMAARRAGLIDMTVPQAMEEWASNKLRLQMPGGVVGHHVTDQVFHMGYGLALGVLYAALNGDERRATVRRGLLFGFGEWLFGFFVLVPSLGVTRPAWRSSPRATLVNVGAHALHGLVTALLTEELLQQSAHGPSTDAYRQRVKVG